MAWYLYLLECEDGSVYTGIAVDVEKRYAQHASGKGARYTRARKPKRLLGSQEYADRSAASKAEYAVKQLSPAEKRRLARSMKSIKLRPAAPPLRKDAAPRPPQKRKASADSRARAPRPSGRRKKP